MAEFEYYKGELAETPEDLKKEAARRKTKTVVEKIPLHKRSEYEARKVGWEVDYAYSDGKHIRMRRTKRTGERLEDDVWLLFYRLGFTTMNKGRGFQLLWNEGVPSLQIDVLAKDENNMFVIECKEKEELGDRELKKELAWFCENRKEKERTLHKFLGKGKITFLFTTRNIHWREPERGLADAYRGKRESFDYWDDDVLAAHEQLVDTLGACARYQLYGVLFKGKGIGELRDTCVPAISARWGRTRVYSFVIQPGTLLKIAYVHRRGAPLKDMPGSYQRMLQKGRLKKISGFISGSKKHGIPPGDFPNNIILNFTEPPTFHPVEMGSLVGLPARLVKRVLRDAKLGDIKFGILRLPTSYASAWVIDGQHRLFGFCDNERRFQSTVPVLAFEKRKPEDQLRLFVEINDNQRPVDSNLLWDLRSDFYEGSRDDKYQHLRAISLLAKRLESDVDSPLRNRIRIPSRPWRDGHYTNLTMSTVCDGVKDGRLIYKPEKEGERQGLLYDGRSYESTVDWAAKRLIAYFDVVRQMSSEMSEDWEKGEEGLCRSNIGVGIFIILLESILEWLTRRGGETARVVGRRNLRSFKEEIKSLLLPAFEWLQEAGDARRSEIRAATGKGPRKKNAMRIALKIEERYRTFAPRLLREWSEVSEVPPSGELQRAAIETERFLREFIARTFNECYKSEDWWREDIIPKDIKDKVEQKIERELKKYPFDKRTLASMQPGEKLEHITTAQAETIILKSKNWPAFEPSFADKEYAQAYLRFFTDLRNPEAHGVRDSARFDPKIVSHMGYGALVWLRKCMQPDRSLA